MFFSILTAVSCQDVKTRTIDDRFILAILALSVATGVFVPGMTVGDRLLGFFAVSGLMAAVTLALPGAFGGGDIKLMAASGAFLGWQRSLEAFVYAVFLGAVYAAYLLIGKKKERTSAFAFGPFLCAGMVLSIFHSFLTY